MNLDKHTTIARLRSEIAEHVRFCRERRTRYWNYRAEGKTDTEALSALYVSTTHSRPGDAGEMVVSYRAHEPRNLHLALGILRCHSYKAIENRCHTPPNAESVARALVDAAMWYEAPVGKWARWQESPNAPLALAMVPAIAAWLAGTAFVGDIADAAPSELAAVAA